MKAFQPNLIYVFTKKKYREGQQQPMTQMEKRWVNKINGRSVRVVGKYEGLIGDYRVLPEWCKCVGRENSNENRFY